MIELIMLGKLKTESDPVSKESIKKLISFIPYFSENTDFGKCYGGDKKSNTIVMPMIEYSDKVNEFISLLYNTGIVIRFDWIKWSEEGKNILSDPKLLNNADLLEIRKIFTIIIRRERFCEGALLQKIKDGTVSRLLERLNAILETL